MKFSKVCPVGPVDSKRPGYGTLYISYFMQWEIIYASTFLKWKINGLKDASIVY